MARKQASKKGKKNRLSASAWSSPKHRYGQVHLSNADISGRPTLRAAYDDIVPQVAAETKDPERQFAREYGLTSSKPHARTR